MCSAAPEAAKEPPTPIRISIEPVPVVVVAGVAWGASLRLLSLSYAYTWHALLLSSQTFAALGPSHAALGMNNIVYFHALDQPGCPMVSEREYLGTVEVSPMN